MREIKFRAWDNEHNTGMFYPLEWFFGNVVKAKHPAGKTIEVIPMQMTGLKDKNGKEIYEGDILHWIYEGLLAEATDYRGVVVWWDYGAGFHVNLRNDGDTITPIPHTTEPDGKTLEVIGNIYENKDLLK